MAIEIKTIVTVASAPGKRFPNVILEDARFFGRPNFSGAMDAFNNDDRQFTVLIPMDAAQQLKDFGYNVKLTEPKTDDQEPLAHLKVKIDFSFDPQFPGDFTKERGSKVYVKQGENMEQLHSNTIAILDRSFIEYMDMELRGWEYNPEEMPGVLSCRLVSLVATLRQSLLSNKYNTI